MPLNGRDSEFPSDRVHKASITFAADDVLETSTSHRTAVQQGWLECAVIGAVAAFVAYFSMCAFRRAFMVLEFPGVMLGNGPVELKTSLLVSQILGYGISKYLGISVCSQVARQRMWLMLVLLIGVAQAALILFAVVPPGWMLLAMFLNGLPLGMIWGLMVRYLEGRQMSDLMLAVLSCSFILGSGVVKDVGRWWLHQNVIPDVWMPAVTGFCFLPPFLIAVFFLHRLPVPNAVDIELRNERISMTATDRWAFVRDYCWTLIPLLLFYLVLTAFRDYRDLYVIEIVKELGYGAVPAVLTRIELPIAILVTAVLGLLSVIRNSTTALWAIYGVMLLGMLTIGLGEILFRLKGIDGMTWMILMGLGAYLAYVPYNAVLFERFMASTRATGTAVFGIYLADALGYTGSIGLLLSKDLLFSMDSRLAFFQMFSLAMAASGTVCLLWSGWHLRGEFQAETTNNEHIHKQQ